MENEEIGAECGDFAAREGNDEYPRDEACANNCFRDHLRSTQSPESIIGSICQRECAGESIAACRPRCRSLLEGRYSLILPVL